MFNTIDAMWMKFTQLYVPQKAHPEYRENLRLAFYAGAGGVVALLHELDHNHVSPEAGSAILRGLQSELRDYVPARPARR